MTVTKLINILTKLPPNAEVEVWAPKLDVATNNIDVSYNPTNHTVLINEK